MIQFDLHKGKIAALSTNAERTRCLVGGRNLLCIMKMKNFALNDDQKPTFDIIKNLRNRRSSLEHTALEIQWNQKDSDKIIFSTVNSAIQLYSVT